jgi:hypothetical protein
VFTQSFTVKNFSRTFRPGHGSNSSSHGENSGEQETTYEQQQGETTPPGSPGERDVTPMETEEELIARGNKILDEEDPESPAPKSRHDSIGISSLEQKMKTLASSDTGKNISTVKVTAVRADPIVPVAMMMKMFLKYR